MIRDPRLAPVDELMREALEPPTPITKGLYGWLRYQMGWSQHEGTPSVPAAGKGLRPLLCLVACQAVGSDPILAVPAAAAIELTHAFSLVHDDIEDGDAMRRGREALWSLVGIAQGINAGDALFGLARRQLLMSPVPDSTLRNMIARYDDACIRLAEGQYLDLEFEHQEIQRTEYLQMVARKTGALMAAATALGSLAGGGSEDVATAMAEFGEAVGIAFQIRDDILGIWGDPELTGKPTGGDLSRRKKSMPVVLAMGRPELALAVRELYASARPEAARAERLAAAMDRAGIRAAAVREAEIEAMRARSALAGLKLVAEPAAELAALVASAVARDR